MGLRLHMLCRIFHRLNSLTPFPLSPVSVSQRPIASFSSSHKRRDSNLHGDTSSPNFSREKEAVSQKKYPGCSKDERPSVCTDRGSCTGDAAVPQPSAYKPFSMPRKDKEFPIDLKDLQVYCTHTAPDYSLPRQKQRQYTSTGRKLLTHAHCVEHDTQVKVKRRGDDTKYVAKVLARGVDCDTALLSVEIEEFWREVEPLRFGRPYLQDAVTVVGYPLGGDTISVTKGVVPRIQA